MGIVKTPAGERLLPQAAEHVRVECVKRLLAGGAPVNVANACSSGHRIHTQAWQAVIAARARCALSADLWDSKRRVRNHFTAHIAMRKNCLHTARQEEI
eukprot:484905-Rhodomonas_salina.1